ncbi:MAG: ribose 5-phosphate isomerase B [candidate division Zixibacteria bacterium]|nr:ribose 5-phosphate isomerase B [candidate division Zixibacteria bacterium]
MKVAIGSDHAGYELKEKIKAHLEGKFELTDFGTHSTDSTDYPDYANKVACGVASENFEKGILVCWTGNGMAMAANKIKGVRAGLCLNERMAELTRQHNDANVLCLPSLFVKPEDAIVIVDKFFDAEFEGGRHSRRVTKIEQMECGGGFTNIR